MKTQKFQIKLSVIHDMKHFRFVSGDQNKFSTQNSDTDLKQIFDVTDEYSV